MNMSFSYFAVNYIIKDQDLCRAKKQISGEDNYLKLIITLLFPSAVPKKQKKIQY